MHGCPGGDALACTEAVALKWESLGQIRRVQELPVVTGSGCGDIEKRAN